MVHERRGNPGGSYFSADDAFERIENANQIYKMVRSATHGRVSAGRRAEDREHRYWRVQSPESCATLVAMLVVLTSAPPFAIESV